MPHYALMDGIHCISMVIIVSNGVLLEFLNKPDSQCRYGANAAQAFLRMSVCGSCCSCSLRPNRQMAHGLQMAEIAQYKKRKAEKQQQEQLAKKKN